MSEPTGSDYNPSALDLLDPEDGLEATELVIPAYAAPRSTLMWWVAVIVGIAVAGSYSALHGWLAGIEIPVACVALGGAIVASKPGPRLIPVRPLILRFSRQGLEVEGRLLPGFVGYELDPRILRLRWSGGEMVVHVSFDPGLHKRLELALQAVLRLEALNRGEAPPALTALREHQ